MPIETVERHEMTMIRVLAGAILALSISGVSRADEPSTTEDTAATSAGATNVVLVHGATTQGWGWKEVHDILRSKGLKVTVVELPHTSAEDDIAAAKLAVANQSGPTVLVGHSYGGAVITEAGVAPNVKSLVYVAALQPDKGESIAEISSNYPMDIDIKMLDDERYVPNSASYHEVIGADLPRDVTEFMSASSKPMKVDTFEVRFQNAAWHDKPSFGIVPTDDKVLSPDFLRWMYERSGTKVTEVQASHMVYMSQPQVTADVILEAVSSVK